MKRPIDVSFFRRGIQLPPIVHCFGSDFVFARFGLTWRQIMNRSKVPKLWVPSLGPAVYCPVFPLTSILLHGRCILLIFWSFPEVTLVSLANILSFEILVHILAGASLVVAIRQNIVLLSTLNFIMLAATPR
ncbi:hypothetical protein BX600DRAFT_468194 [Xylariales sp. PMI_506]|nr:hypothetical protein BX600DRAFT_468194 [Xylariales sp. PMI_506]